MMLVINNLEMILMFLMMMLKRNMKCHKMRILVMLLNSLKLKFGGLLGKGNHPPGILLMTMLP